MSDMTNNFKWPFPNQPFPLYWKLASMVTIVAIGALGKIFLCYLNSTKIYGRHILCKAVTERPAGVSLVTVSNHHSCIDDPILSGILPWRTIFTPFKLRWTPAAHDICFTKNWHSTFFGLGRTVPVVRGDGVYQRGMDYSLERMNQGEWVHIFPEGRVNMEKTWIRLKWGVGRLISECQHTPVVVPCYHIGFDGILPNKSPYIPRIGNKVTVLVGNPINFEEQLETCRKLGHSAMQMRKMVTDKIQEELDKLKQEAIKLHDIR